LSTCWSSPRATSSPRSGEDLVDRRAFHYPGPAAEGGPEAGERARLDHFLGGCELPLSRSQLRRLIDAGDVLVNGERAKPGRKLRPGDRIEVILRPPAPVETLAEDIPLVVLHEDAHLIVIDKPAGLVVHPAAGHREGTLVNALLH
jgi:23S rRNA pseudouridine1911/1915/1917 synthase